MVTSYTRYYHNQPSYTCVEIMKQWAQIQNRYEETLFESNKKGGFKIYFVLQPTENSIKYKLCISVKVAKLSVKVFPVTPKIPYLCEDGSHTPHMYLDGSLCLHYPEYNEWKPGDSWAETIIPWTAVWLYYYEVWQMTGDWLGGGIHPGQKKEEDRLK